MVISMVGDFDAAGEIEGLTLASAWAASNHRGQATPSGGAQASLGPHQDGAEKISNASPYRSHGFLGTKIATSGGRYAMDVIEQHPRRPRRAPLSRAARQKIALAYSVTSFSQEGLELSGFFSVPICGRDPKKPSRPWRYFSRVEENRSEIVSETEIDRIQNTCMGSH